MEMKKSVELPIVKPIYSVYHAQGVSSAVTFVNPDIRNWHLNQVMILFCNEKFLDGFTTPEINVCQSMLAENPYVDKKWISLQYLGGCTGAVIRAMLDDGCYVYYGAIDDYYVRGKAFYHERHLYHDGLICGYDQNEKTYSILGYDSKWIFRVFKTPQRAFDAGRKSAEKTGRIFGSITAAKPLDARIDIDPKQIYIKLCEYLDSSLAKNPPGVDSHVYGIVVHDYIAMYIDRIADGSIPHERMDWRVFRMIWEHKVFMLERIQVIEKMFEMGSGVSDKYLQIVKESDDARMLYAAYHRKRRDTLLPVIRKKLINLRQQEEAVLTGFVDKLRTIV